MGPYSGGCAWGPTVVVLGGGAVSYPLGGGGRALWQTLGPAWGVSLKGVAVLLFTEGMVSLEIERSYACKCGWPFVPPD
jgi:hypothetical protein